MIVRVILIVMLFVSGMLNAIPIPSKGHTVELKPIHGAEITDTEIAWKYVIPIVLSILYFKWMREERE